jgi:hypothetical protein
MRARRSLETLVAAVSCAPAPLRAVQLSGGVSARATLLSRVNSKANEAAGIKRFMDGAPY